MMFSGKEKIISECLECLSIIMNECASDKISNCQRNRDAEICLLGWILLALWLITIIYMTKVKF